MIRAETSLSFANIATLLWKATVLLWCISKIIIDAEANLPKADLINWKRWWIQNDGRALKRQMKTMMMKNLYQKESDLKAKIQNENSLKSFFFFFFNSKVGNTEVILTFFISCFEIGSSYLHCQERQIRSFTIQSKSFQRIFISVNSVQKTSNLNYCSPNICRKFAMVSNINVNNAKTWLSNRANITSSSFWTSRNFPPSQESTKEFFFLSLERHKKSPAIDYS